MSKLKEGIFKMENYITERVPGTNIINELFSHGIQELIPATVLFDNQSWKVINVGGQGKGKAFNKYLKTGSVIGFFINLSISKTEKKILGLRSRVNPF